VKIILTVDEDDAGESVAKLLNTELIAMEYIDIKD
jgi:5S rRNA maturation endonuclease (ribonuclease M5)